MRIFSILTAISLVISSCGVEPVAASKVETTSATLQTVTAAEQDADKQDVAEQSTSPSETDRETEQKQFSVKTLTPWILIISSAALAACLYVPSPLFKYCAKKIIAKRVRPHYSADDWQRYQDFLRNEFTSKLFRDFEDPDFRAHAGKYGDDWNWNDFGNSSRHSGRHTHQQAETYRGDAHAVLGVSQDAPFTEIKQTYRRLAMRYHPDKNPGDPQAAEKFRKIAEAYEHLENLTKGSP